MIRDHPQTGPAAASLANEAAAPALAQRGGGPYVLALLLAGLAGWVDVAGLTGADGTFVSFMSGNTTQGALLAERENWIPAAHIAATIGSFVGGVAVGEVLGRISGRFGRPVVMLAVAALLGTGAWLSHDGHLGLEETCLLAGAMGLQNATMHSAGGVNVGLTYITGTLVQLGRALADLLTRGQGLGRAGRFFGLWGALALGAAACAGVLQHSRFIALTAAAATAAGLALFCMLPAVRRT